MGVSLEGQPPLPFGGEIELQTKLADSRIVDTNFLTNLLGNGFHDDGDRGVRDVVP